MSPGMQTPCWKRSRLDNVDQRAVVATEAHAVAPARVTLRRADEAGRAYPIADPQADALRALHASAEHLADPRDGPRDCSITNRVRRFTTQQRGRRAVAPALDALRRVGVSSRLQRALSG